MNIIIRENASASLEDWADSFGLDIIVTERRELDIKRGMERYFASFDKSVRIVDGPFLVSPVNNGSNVEECLEQIVKNYSNQKVKINNTYTQVPTLHR